MMMFCSMELHYIIFLYCILSMRCELCDRDSSVLFYPDYRPWLPGTPFSALFPSFGAGVMGGRHSRGFRLALTNSGGAMEQEASAL